MAHEYIYTCYKLARFYPPDRTVLENISLSFYPGAKIGVLGANGAGKSSLLRIMAGLDDGYTGEARLTPGFTVGYLAQEPQLDPSKDVKGNVMDGVAEVQSVIDRYNEVMAMWADPDADYDKIGALQADLEDKIAAADAWSLERNVEIAMDALRCPPDDADVTTLSGGERRRVALCRLLLSHPDLLLLDEPTNHLDAESVEWLERFLQDYSGTVVAITHDRYFLDNVAKWILELDRGRGIPFEGNYSSWLEQKQERLAREEKSNEARQRTLARELEWVRMAPKARQAKGKARLAAYDKLQSEAEAAERGADSLEITIPVGKRLGDTVIEVAHLDKGFGDRLLIEDLSFSLPKAGIVGIIGPNGAGKTTLFKMLTGQEPHRRRHDRRRRHGAAVLRRPVARRPRPGQDRVRGDHRRGRAHEGRQPRDPRPGVLRELQLQGLGSAEARRRSVRRRAQPRPPRQGAQGRRQRAAARRADQRPRRRHPPGAGDRARVVPRLRRGDQPRPLVPRPHRHPRAGVRGRQPGPLVRGQLHRVRGLAPQGAGFLRRHPPQDQVQTPLALADGVLVARWSGWRAAGARNPLHRTRDTPSPHGPSGQTGHVTKTWISRGCAAVFVVGIAGIIVTSIVNNNNGLVITFGAMMTLAAIVLIAVNAVTSKESIDVFDEARAEQLEARIGDLVAAGADEAEVRALVRDAQRLRG